MLINKLNNKIYIGKAKCLKERIRRHELSIRFIKEKYPIAAAIKKHGWHNFEVKILEEFPLITNKSLLQRESFWIKSLNSTNRKIGYNLLSYGADWTGYKHTKESKAKISKNRKGKCLGKDNPIWGQSRPQSVKDAVSKANTGSIAINRKSIRQINSQTGEEIKTWDCVKDASIFLNISLTHIAAAARKRIKVVNGKEYITNTAGGFKWEYV